MVEIRDLHLSLVGGAGPVNILRGLDLTIERGETVSIVGPSGAGKSTMIGLVCAFHSPESGRVLVDGEMAYPGAVVFASRSQTLSATLEGQISKCLSVDELTGNIVLDKDFGAGYSYPVLLEDASVTPE